MPFVRVTLYEGRSTEKKRRIAEAITEALVTIGGTTREACQVVFEDVAKNDWVTGGAPEFSSKAATR
ncbi:MAG TPA: 4-oxalocrotonate tautomerase family protein [bacterium]|nr:4-oxalocrotonate tautomerase family protein [bacterium]